MEKDNNIILIGMPGAGKSTLGVTLAKVLAYRFVDTDLLLQEQTGKRLFQIIAQNGNDAFLKLENQLVSEMTAHHCVIATGGSVVYGKEAMAHLHAIGTVVYLKISCDEMIARIGDFRTRGIAMGKFHDLSQLYNEREPLYAATADLTLEPDHVSARKNLEKMIKTLRDNGLILPGDE